MIPCVLPAVPALSATNVDRFWAGLRLLRLSNAIPAALLVLLGGRLTGVSPLPGEAVMAAGAMWCITAYGYVSNDLADRVEDRMNKPDRPLPSGLISASVARWMATLLAGLGLVLALGSGGLLPVGAAGIALSLLTWYNRHWKSSAGGGNLLIGGLAGSTLLVGGYAAAGWTGVAANLLPGAVLFAFITARELLKAAEDVAGDRAAGKPTAATVHGSRWVIRRVALLAGITTLLSVLPVIVLGYSWAYLAIIGLGVDGALIYAAIYLWADARPSRVSHCLALLKGSYFAGLLALLLA